MQQEQGFVKCFRHTDSSTCVYVVVDDESQHCAIIDSAADFNIVTASITHAHADEVCAYVTEHKLTVDYILETHVHADHLTASQYIKSKVGGRVGIGAGVEKVQQHFARVFNTNFTHGSGGGGGGGDDGQQLFDVQFADGDTFSVGTGLRVRVLATPGHTPACISYVFTTTGSANNPDTPPPPPTVFCGDTLFHPSSGTARCDFPGGSSSQLYTSIQKLLALPPDTRIFLAHDYPGEARPFCWMTTVAEHLAGNKMVRRGVTQQEYVHVRDVRDATLSFPRLLYPSIQVNLRAGHPPPPEHNGTSYIKLPLNLQKL